MNLKNSHRIGFGKTTIVLLAVAFFICSFTVAASAVEVGKLIPMGNTVGIKVFCEGVIVIETNTVDTMSGKRSPAADAGLREGDIILEINGKKVTSAEALQTAIDECNEQSVLVKYKRDEESGQIGVTPLKSAKDGHFKLGVIIRDSMAGIGTVTFYDPENGQFGALGHSISDIDTGKKIPIGSGSTIPSIVSGINKGQAGQPGELQGEFDVTNETGKITKNTEGGIFGEFYKNSTPVSTWAIPIVPRSEIRQGPAKILCNVRSDQVEEYQVEIMTVYPETGDQQRDMMIKVTDERLLDQTGGIVQGMSGSPIIQDGKLIGAVTHVLVNDPKRGYAISIEKMLEYCYNEVKIVA